MLRFLNDDRTPVRRLRPARRGHDIRGGPMGQRKDCARWSASSWAAKATGTSCATRPCSSTPSASRTKRACSRRTGCRTTCSNMRRTPGRAACAASSPARAARRTFRACSRRRPRCPCSGFPCRRSTCAARIPCTRSSRCRRASRSRRSPSARPARRTPACSPSRCSPAPIPPSRRKLAAFRLKQTNAARAMRVPPASLTRWRS